MWLRARDKRGFPVPWVWVRRRLAQQWQCRPWEVDDAPYDEVLTELRLMQLESENQPRQ